MSISQLAKEIPDSPTLALNEAARLLRQKGEPVIHLGIGEPKNKVPISAILNSAAHLLTGEVKYTPVDGTPSLKRAIVRYMEECYDKIVPPENVIVSEGAKQSIYNVLLSIINPQDEVIILSPYWVSYPEMVRMAYGVPVIVQPEDGRHQPRMIDIEPRVTSYTKAIIINSPNNPSGAVYSSEFLAEIIDFCEARNIYVIMDDIYHRLVFDGVVAPSAYQFTRKNLESSRLIVINGVSKVYGMTGFRIGWAVGPRPVVEAMTRIQAQTTSSPSDVSQAAAEGALTGVQSVVESLRLTIQTNRNVMMEELRSFSGVHIIKPQGTFYALPDFSAYNMGSRELAEFLLKKALVVTVPGDEFGMKGHLRLSYAGGMKEIREGLKRMKWALDPESPNEIYIGDRKLVRDWI